MIKLVHSDTLKLLKLSGTFEPDDVIAAPTGVAAFNINGMTLHSAFLLGRSHDRRNTLRTKLSRLMFVRLTPTRTIRASNARECIRLYRGNGARATRRLPKANVYGHVMFHPRPSTVFNVSLPRTIKLAQ